MLYQIPAAEMTNLSAAWCQNQINYLPVSGISHSHCSTSTWWA